MNPDLNVGGSILKLFSAKFFSSIISVVALIYYSRELGAATIGIFFLFQAALGFSSLLADFGMQGAAVKRLSEKEDTAVVFWTGAVMLFVSTTVVSGIAYFFQNKLDSYIGAPVTILLIVALVGTQAAGYLKSGLKGTLRVGKTAPIMLASRFTQSVVVVILVYFGYGLNALFAALFFQIGVDIVLSIYYLSIPLGRPSLKSAKSIFHYAKFDVFAFVDDFLYKWLDTAIIGFFLTSTAVGAYEIAWRITAFTMLFSGSIETTIFPQISSWSSRGDVNQIESLIPKAITASLFLVIPAIAGAWILGRQILRIIFGPEFVIASVPLAILMTGKFVEGIDRILKSTLSGMDQPELRARAVIVSTFLNATLNFALIPTFGLIGAAFATTLSFSISTILISYYVSQHISIRLQYRALGWAIFSAGIMLYFEHLLLSRNLIESSFSVILAIVAGAFIYFLLALAHPTYQRYFRNIISQLGIRS